MLKHSPEIQELLAKCCLSTRTTAEVMFPDIFYAPFSGLHEQIFNLVDSKDKYIAIAAPRGLGKTSIARIVAAKELLYRNTNFILYVSQSSTFAEMQTENLKSDLRTAPVIRELFGDIKMSEADGLDDTFSKMAWVAFGSTLVLPRGAGQQVRGSNWRNNRPNLIIIDDLENKDEILNEENRKKLKQWFYGDLLRCVNKYDNNWRFIYIDTIKHEDSLLANLVDENNKTWTSIVLEICDDNLKSNAPDYMTDEEILKEYQSYAEVGELDTFFMELRNIPISTADAAFRQSYFKYYDELDAQLDGNFDVENVVIYDPAKSVKPHSAESAIIGIGINRISKAIYVRDAIGKKLHPDQAINEALDMCQRLRSPVLAVEVTGLEEFITYPIKNAIAERGMVNLELVELKARTNKVEKRIPALIPLYRKGQILHNKAVCTPLEQQLLSFPRSRRLDLMDALAYVVELLEKGMRYFHEEDDLEEPQEEEFEPRYGRDELELEEWRCI